MLANTLVSIVTVAVINLLGVLVIIPEPRETAF